MKEVFEMDNKNFKATVEYNEAYLVQASVGIETEDVKLTVTREHQALMSPLAQGDGVGNFWCLYGDGMNNPEFSSDDELLDFFKSVCSFGYYDGVEIENSATCSYAYDNKRDAVEFVQRWAKILDDDVLEVVDLSGTGYSKGDVYLAVGVIRKSNLVEWGLVNEDITDDELKKIVEREVESVKFLGEQMRAYMYDGSYFIENHTEEYSTECYSSRALELTLAEWLEGQELEDAVKACENL